MNLIALFLAIIFWVIMAHVLEGWVMDKPWTYRLKKLIYSYGWRRWYRLKSRDRTPPSPVKVKITSREVVKYKLCPIIREYKRMQKAQVTVGWVGSVSNDVDLYEVVVKLGGDQVSADTLPFTVNEYVCPVLFDEGDVVTAEVVAVDLAGNRSDTAVASVTIPDFNAPAAVTDLGFTVDIVDVEEPTPEV